MRAFRFDGVAQVLFHRACRVGCRSKLYRIKAAQAARSGTPYGREAWAPVLRAVPIGRPHERTPTDAVTRSTVNAWTRSPLWTGY
jgi:hypothetical protein